MLALESANGDNDGMSEIPRPVTKAFYMHEKYSLPSAAEGIAAFQETGKPTVLWWQEWSEEGSGIRSYYLTSSERDQAMMQVFAMCGIQEDFHRHVKLMKKPGQTDIVWAEESTFAESKLSLTSIFSWLGARMISGQMSRMILM